MFTTNLRNFAKLARFAAKFLVEKPPNLRSIGLGSRFDYGWSVEGAKWIDIGSNCQFRHHVNLSAIANTSHVDDASKLSIDDDVYVGPYCFVIALRHVHIGAGVVFSERVLVCDNSHGFDPLGDAIMKQPYHFGGPVTIGEKTFVGYGACILPGVKIGKNCVVGANAVVTESFPDLTLIAGNPARAVRRWDSSTKLWSALSKDASV